MLRYKTAGTFVPSKFCTVFQTNEPIRKSIMSIVTPQSVIVRRVTVDLSLTGQQALDATGRKQYANPTVLAEMPRGTSTEVGVHFFKINSYVSCADLVKEYELRGLEPVDPFLLAAINQVDPAFADAHPNATQWTDSKGKFCCAIFDCWHGERRVRVGQGGDVWLGDWRFGGVHKSAQA